MENIQDNQHFSEEIGEKSFVINEYDTEKIALHLAFSKEDFEKLKAGAFYNNYRALEDFVANTVLNEVESDRQRYLKSKVSSKNK